MYRCDACGDAYARVEVPHGCDVRVCCLCARRSAQKLVGRLTRAAALLPRILATARPVIGAKVERLVNDATARQDRWKGRQGVRAVTTLARVGPQLARHKRAREGLRRFDRNAWGWKVLTISPPWSPELAESYSVQGIRARIDDVWSRWRAIWSEGMSVAGLAAAYARVELSPGGHIHLHAVYYGPRWEHEWLTRVAGCHVWIEAARGDDVNAAIREAVKYTVKAPTPSRPSWLAGDERWMMHPTLAARWVVASRHAKLAEPYGTMRTALGAVEEEEKQTGSVPPECATCGAQLGDESAREEPTAAVARALGAEWRTKARKALRGLVFRQPRVHFVSPPRAP